MAVIEFQNVAKRFHSKTALDSISFELREGSVAALVGKNGAGKSTLLHLAIGFIKPSSGVVTVLGKPPSHKSQWLSKIGFVDQNASLPQHLTLGNLADSLRQYNVTWNHNQLLQHLDALDLPIATPIKRLSKGQTHAAAVTLCLAKQPKLIMLDEPLASLDPISRRTMMGIVLTFAYEHGVTVLLSSHLLNDLERSCDSIIALDHGRIALAEQIDNISSHYFWTPFISDIENKLLYQQIPGASLVWKGDTQLLLKINSDYTYLDLQLTPVGLEELVIGLLGANHDTQTQQPKEKSNEQNVD